MILRFNEREIDTEEYNLSFQEGCRVDSGEVTFQEVMYTMDIEEDEVDFSFNSGEDGLPEGPEFSVYGSIAEWVNLYNYKVLEPYSDKETNILINDLGEDGIQLLYLFHYDLSAESDYNDEQYDILQHLFEMMDKQGPAYQAAGEVLNEYQDGLLKAEEVYVLLKITFRDKHLAN